MRLTRALATTSYEGCLEVSDAASLSQKWYVPITFRPAQCAALTTRQLLTRACVTCWDNPTKVGFYRQPDISGLLTGIGP